MTSSRTGTLLAAALIALWTGTAAPQEQQTRGQTQEDLPPNPRTLAAAGKVEEAIEAWKAWAKREPTNADHRLGLIKLLRDSSRLNDALDECDVALRALPKNYDLLLLMAEICQRKGETLVSIRGGRGNAVMYFEDVIRFSNQAQQLAPTRREPHALRGMSLFALGRVDEARAEADKLCQLFPNHPGGYVLCGEIALADYQKQKQNDGATKQGIADLAAELRTAFEKARDLDPSRVLPWRRLGDIEAWEGNLEIALAHYAEALSRDPQRGAPLDWLATVTSSEQRIQMLATAIQRFQALRTKPASALADLHWQCGLLLFQIKRWAECRTQMVACHRLRADYLNAYFYFGLASFHLGDGDGGLVGFGSLAAKSPTMLAQALRDSGESAEAHTGIVAHYADLAHKRGNAPLSRDLNYAIALYEDTPERWNNYAFLCRETGRYEDSWKAYQKALELSPEDPQLLNDAAVIMQYHLRSDVALARKMYNDAIAHAKRLLADTKTSAEERARYRQALQDARGNLITMNRK